MLRSRLSFLIALLFVFTAIIPASIAQDANVDVFGRALPSDAAPYDQQVFSDVCEPERTRVSSSSMVSVYRRLCLVDMHSDPLVDLDNNLQLIPAAAEAGSLPKTA